MSIDCVSKFAVVAFCGSESIRLEWISDVMPTMMFGTWISLENEHFLAKGWGDFRMKVCPELAACLFVLSRRSGMSVYLSITHYWANDIIVIDDLIAACFRTERLNIRWRNRLIWRWLMSTNISDTKLYEWWCCRKIISSVEVPW